jgi:hypothetical protein
MRTALSALLVVTLAAAIEAQQPLTLDDPIREELRIDNPRFVDPCASGQAVDQIARAAHMLVGFESTPDCWLCPRSLWAAPDGDILTGMSARQAFDHLIASMPTDSWKALNGIVVVRPTSAWNDPDNLLNQPVQPFEATNEHVVDILHAVLRATTPPLFLPHQDLPRSGELVNHSMTVVFPGGTMLDALNAVVRAHGSAEWQVGYASGFARIVVSTLAFMETRSWHQRPCHGVRV